MHVLLHPRRLVGRLPAVLLLGSVLVLPVLGRDGGPPLPALLDELLLALLVAAVGRVRVKVRVVYG